MNNQTQQVYVQPQFVQQQHYVIGQPAELPHNYIYASQVPAGTKLEYLYPQHQTQQQQQQPLQQQQQNNYQSENQSRVNNVNIPSHSSTPYLIPAVATRKTETVVVRQEDSGEMIRIQAQRIARLEERSDLLTKQYQRYQSALGYKEQEISHWQERCNILQAHLETPYKRIEELQYEKNEVKIDQERLLKIEASGKEEFAALETLKLQKDADIKFWKERAKKAEKAQTIIMSLEHRAKILQIENERLNNLLNKTNRNAPTIQGPVWPNN